MAFSESEKVLSRRLSDGLSTSFWPSGWCS